MAAAVHFVKQDFTGRTFTSTTAVEQTNYTISWANLTGAGLAAGDDVAVLVLVRLNNSSNANRTNFQVGFGTTYAGRANEADSLSEWEAAVGSNTNMGHQVVWLDRRTLVTNENIYFSNWVEAGTGGVDEFHCLVLKLGSLGANDYLYAEATHSGDVGTTYGTSGASVTTSALGDWVFFGTTRWLDDDTTDDCIMAIAVDGADYAEYSLEGEDLAGSYCIGTMTYHAALASSKVARVRYKTLEGFQDVTRTAILGLRLDAFKDHVGTRTTNTITHSVVDTYQEFWGPTYTASQTGNVLAYGLPIHTRTENVKRAYGRIQLAGVDWPSSGANRAGALDNGATTLNGPFIHGYASVSSGSLDFDMDVAEDVDINPTYNCDKQIGVIFSLELATGAAPTGSATGKVGAKGSVGTTAKAATSAAVTGRVGAKGSETGVHGGLGAATGRAGSAGAAKGVYGVRGSATGKVGVKGNSAGVHGGLGSSTGKVGAAGAAIGIGVATLTPALFNDSPDTFYSATVTPGAVTLTPSLYDDAPDTFYSPTVAQVQILSATLFDDAPDTFFSPTVTVGAATLLPSLYNDAPDTFYSATVTPGAVTLTPTLFDDTPDTFFSPTVTGGSMTLLPDLFDDAPDTFYTHTITVTGGTVDFVTRGRSAREEGFAIAQAVALWLEKNKQFEPIVEEQLEIIEEQKELLLDVPEEKAEPLRKEIKRRKDYVSNIRREIQRLEYVSENNKKIKLNEIKKKIFTAQKKIDSLVNDVQQMTYRQDKEYMEVNEVVEIIDIIEELGL